MSAQAELDRYLGALADRLPADDTTSRDLLDEARDHLLSDVESRTARGVPLPLAVTSALADFGPLVATALLLRGEVLRGQVRRACTALLAVALLLGAAWLAALLAGPGEPWPDPREPFPIDVLAALGRFTAPLAVLSSAASVLLLVLTGRMWTRPGLRAAGQRWAMLAGGTSVLSGATTVVLLAAYVTIRGLLAPGSLSWTAVAAASLASVAGVVPVGRAVWRLAFLHRATIAA